MIPASARLTHACIAAVEITVAIVKEQQTRGNEQRGGWKLEVEKRSDNANKVAEAARERRCVHYAEGAAGEFYPGRAYVGALRRLRGPVALRLSRLVEPFFWEDAHLMRIWMCRGCAEDLGIRTGEQN